MFLYFFCPLTKFIQFLVDKYFQQVYYLISDKKMHLNADISSALQLLEDIKLTINELDDLKLQGNANREINVLVSVLENPIFRSIVTIQDSLYELNQQLGQHPSILPVDFDITLTGELALNVPPVELFDPGYAEDYHHSHDYDEQRVPSAPVSPESPQLHTFNEDNVLLRSGKSLTADFLPPKNSHGPNEEENIYRSPSAISDTSKAGSDAILSSEWAQVEAIDLINDGTGLGFGIVGVRTMGVVVKTILPGGVADRDGRLQSGDHILQIGDVNLHEMGSEQVATVLRQSGTHVRLVVARPAEFSLSSDYKYLSSSAPLVPTRLLNDPNELDQYLIQHKYPPIFKNSIMETGTLNNSNISPTNSALVTTSAAPSSLSIEAKVPEMEKFTVELRKDHNGLGITIAGYVCEKEELSGIFIKSISKGSAADLSKKIQVNDRIVEVDGRSLQGYTNLQAVEVLRSCGSEVKLCLERYLHGPKFEQLQQAIAATTFCNSNQNQRVSGKREASVSGMKQDMVKPIETRNEFVNLAQTSQEPTELTPVETEAIKKKWKEIIGQNFEIVIAQLTKFGERGGLGISLEGTVDVEDGQEVRPHHYIRSILPEGPVGKNGKLRSGDELLEVNGHRLLGMNHHEVVSILKELPIHVRMVCGRPNNGDKSTFKILQDSPFCQRGNALGGSLQNLFPASDRLVKAKSDGSLTTSIGVSGTSEGTLSKMKSRSLEPLTGLAMWSSEPQVIELVKGERGLGFSILDYQDPIDPNDTVIVIRSLVPGGVAQMDGRLIPGDRLLFVNDTILENASLDQAVQALKGAPKGIVRIGVAKPLPVLDSLPHNA